MPWDLPGNSGTDPNTDFLGTTDNQPLVIKTGGQERLRITPWEEGRVAIGTTTTEFGKLTVEHHSVPLALRESDQPVTEGGLWRMPLDEGMWRFDVNTAPAGDFSTFSTLLTMLPSGDVHLGGTESGGNVMVRGSFGIGMVEPTGKLTVAGGPAFFIESTVGIGTWAPAGKLTVAGGDVFVMDGSICVGKWVPEAKLDVAGDIRANDIILNSDARLKTDVAPVNDALAKLRKVRGVTFAWGVDSGESFGFPTARGGAGVIAQEVENVLPEFVNSRGEGGYKGVNYGGLIAVLIEASKELKEENDALKRRIEALERAGRQDEGDARQTRLRKD